MNMAWRGASNIEQPELFQLSYPAASKFPQKRWT